MLITPHCTVGHCQKGPAGISHGWHGDQVKPSAMQTDMSDWQTNTCTQAHTLAQNTMVD